VGPRRVIVLTVAPLYSHKTLGMTGQGSHGTEHVNDASQKTCYP
jgi:hypothetical protein